MPELPPLTDGRLADNIVHFARALRAAGMRVGPGRVIDAVEAVAAAGFTRKADFYWTLHACFVSRRADRAVFDAAFKLFWRDPQLIEKMMATMLSETIAAPEERKPNAAERRAEEAMTAGADVPKPPPPPEEGEEIEFDATLTFSDTEKLRARDFEQMSTAEINAAKAAIARMSLPVEKLRSRRTRADAHGPKPDWRATFRTATRMGGEIHRIERRAQRERWPNLVALCDISGSMGAYSRMLLHFLHSVSNARGDGWAKVHAFVFGTRLTNITRHLALKDVDEALESAGEDVLDWEGGTRIGESLHEFNRDWSRRVLGQGVVVLLITDGLDRGEPSELAKEADRLRRSSRKLIWLNPLLRWEGFAPKAQGVRALLPRVDSFRSAHNIESLDSLAEALSRPDDEGERRRLMAMLAPDPAVA